MKLGTRVGLEPGHVMLDGDPAPLPQRGIAHQFSAHIRCGQMAGWIKMPLGMEVGFGPGDFVLHGDPAPSSKRGRSPQFLAQVYCGQIKMAIGMEVRLDRSRPDCARWRPGSPSPKRRRLDE